MTDDPIEIVERGIAVAGDDRRILEMIGLELDRFACAVTRDTLVALAEEDDGDERLRLLDLHVFFMEQLERAHEAFVEHLRQLVEARGR